MEFIDTYIIELENEINDLQIQVESIPKGTLQRIKEYAYLSYSTMTSNSGSFYGLGKDITAIDCATTSQTSSTNAYSKNVKTDCKDITTFLKECYSEYATYWNFNSNWTWEGKIGGAQVKVNCPKLSWE